jgi:hypothetical protein
VVQACLCADTITPYSLLVFAVHCNRLTAFTQSAFYVQYIGSIFQSAAW